MKAVSWTQAFAIRCLTTSKRDYRRRKWPNKCNQKVPVLICLAGFLVDAMFTRMVLVSVLT